MKTADKFREYLFALIPKEYPISGIPLSLKMTDAHRKELIFQQAKFLKTACEYTQCQPWVAYVAALKHLKLLEIYGIETSTFHEISDKEYFDAVQKECQDILTASGSLLDEDTTSNCERLVKIQLLWPSLVEALHVVQEARTLDINSFDPLMTKPEEKSFINEGLITGGPAALISVIALVVTGAKGAFLPVTFLALAIAAAVYFVLTKLERDKIEELKRKYAAFKRLHLSYKKITSVFKKPLGFDAHEMAKNFEVCMEELQKLMNEREILASTYLEPYT